MTFQRKPAGLITEVNSNSSQVQNLVGWWPEMDSGLGIIRDRSIGTLGQPGNVTSGQRTDLIPSGTSLLEANEVGVRVHGQTGTAGQFAQGLNTFDHINGYPMGMSVWVRTRSTVPNNEVPFWWGDNARNDSYFEFFGTGTAIGARFRRPGQIIDIVGPSWVANSVYFLTLAAKGTTERKLWINGRLDTLETTVMGAITFNEWDSLSLGRSGDSSPASEFNGQMWDARMYNKYPTDGEVMNMYREQWDLWQAPRKNYFVPTAPPAVGANPAALLVGL